MSSVRDENDGRRNPFSYAEAPRKKHPIAKAILIITLGALLAKYVIIPWRHKHENPTASTVAEVVATTKPVTTTTKPSLAQADEARVMKTILALTVWIDSRSETATGKVLDETVRRMTAAVTSEIYWHQTTGKERDQVKEILRGKEYKNIPVPTGLRESLAKLGDFETSLPPVWDKDFNIPATLTHIEADKLKAAASKAVCDKFKKAKADNDKVTMYVLGVIPDRSAGAKSPAKKRR